MLQQNKVVSFLLSWRDDCHKSLSEAIKSDEMILIEFYAQALSNCKAQLKEAGYYGEAL